MSSKNGNRDGDLELLVEAFFKRRSFDERLGDSLADNLEADAVNEEMSPEFTERATAAARRGMLDGAVARARSDLTGSLGAFDTALTRIREAARLSRAQMAERAGISEDLWARLEEQRIALDSVEIRHLTGVVEATQLRLPEFRAAIKRSLNIRLVPGGQASFRSDGDASSDAMAAYQDLMDAASEGTEASRESADAANSLADEISAELRRRGRSDLL